VGDLIIMVNAKRLHIQENLIRGGGGYFMGNKVLAMLRISQRKVVWMWIRDKKGEQSIY